MRKDQFRERTLWEFRWQLLYWMELTNLDNHTLARVVKIPVQSLRDMKARPSLRVIDRMARLFGLSRWDLLVYPVAKLRGGGEVRHVHSSWQCKGQTCSIHNPSKHHMSKWSQLWRTDRYMMERTCPHGVGHPDPDHMDYLRRTLGPGPARLEGIHGCDGCCTKRAVP